MTCGHFAPTNSPTRWSVRPKRRHPAHCRSVSNYLQATPVAGVVVATRDRRVAGTHRRLSTLNTRVLKSTLGRLEEIDSMSSTTLTFPTPASLGSLDHYIQAVNRFPLLSAEQEVEFGRRLRDTNDLDAARQLVLSHLRLVVAISR